MITYITNKAQTKQVRKFKNAVNRTNNLKAKANLKQSNRQQTLPSSNRDKLNKAEPNLETRGR